MNIRFSPADNEQVGVAAPPNAYVPELGRDVLSRAQRHDIAALFVPGVRVRFCWHLPAAGVDEESPSVVWTGTIVDESTIKVDAGCQGAAPEGGFYPFPPENINDRIVEITWVAFFRKPTGVPHIAPVNKRPREDFILVQAMERVLERQAGDDSGAKIELCPGLKIPANISELFRWTAAHTYYSQAAKWKAEVDTFYHRKNVAFADGRYKAEWYAHIDCVESMLSCHADAAHLREKRNFFHLFYIIARIVALAMLGSSKTKAGEHYEKLKLQFDEEWLKCETILNFERWFRKP